MTESFSAGTTERRALTAVTRALEGSEAVVRTLLESASEGIVIVDREGGIVLVNARAEELFGYRRDELLGQPLGLLLPERDRQAHTGHCSGYFRHPRRRAMGPAAMGGGRAKGGAGPGGRLELTARRKDGSEFPVEVSLSFAEVEGALYASSFVSDISERVRAQQALHVYSERLEHLVEERTRELRQAQDRILAQQRLQRDLELAQQVQASLLPRHVPSLEGYEFAAAARPARYVSGDVYDFFPCDSRACDGESCHLVLADIAGKGVPAALLASTARTLMHAETGHEDSPAAILDGVGRVLEEDLAHAEMYITAFAARLDARLGRLVYANAGHTEALWWQGVHRTCRRLPATGLPLGLTALLSDRVPGGEGQGEGTPEAKVRPGHLDRSSGRPRHQNVGPRSGVPQVPNAPETGASLTEEAIWLRPGDTLLFYSDGITEAANADGALYGAERLAALLEVKAALSADDLAREIVGAVDAFCGGEPRSDDLTLIVLKVLPRSISFRHPATLEHLEQMVSLVRQVSSVYGQEFAYQMELATCEVVTNVMRHACGFEGEIRGQVTIHPDRVEVDLYDDGVACDLQALPAPTLGELREGGYGLHVARELLDELSYTPAIAAEARAGEARAIDEPVANHWRLVKRAQEGPTHYAT